MPVRMTGMMSGLDTEALIKGMVDAQKIKNKKTSDKSQILDWKQEKLKELNSKLYKLYAEDLTKLKFQSNYNSKKVTSSNENYVTVTGNSNAPVGNAEIKVNSLATSQTVIGKSLGSNVTSSTKLVDLVNGGFTSGSEIIVTNGTKESKFTVSDKTTINDFVSALKKAGLSANFDNAQKRIFITSANSGSDNKFTITTNQQGAGALKDSIREQIKFSSMTSEEQKDVNLQLSIIATSSNDVDVNNAKAKLTEIVSKNKLDNLKSEELNKITDKYKADIITGYKEDALLAYTSTFDAEFASIYPADGTKTSDDVFKESEKYTELVTELTNNGKISDTDSESDVLTKVKDEYKKQLFSESEENAVKLMLKEYYSSTFVNVDNLDETAKDLAITKLADDKFNQLKTAGKATYQGFSDEIFNNGVSKDGKVSYKKLANDDLLQKIQEEAATAVDAETDASWNKIIRNEVEKLSTDISSFRTSSLSGDEKILVGLGIGTITGEAISGDGSNTMSVTAAKDAEILYNGVAIKSTSNTIAVNGFNITLKGNPPAGEAITLSSSTDTESTVKAVKEFVKKYNEILKEMNSLYYASSAKDYAPLSDDEKEAMSESQIEKWEQKIKDSMLRRDDSIGSILSVLKNVTSTTITASDGKKYSLSSFGIGTSTDYTEKGLLHINGDPEDAATSFATDKLSAMLESDPEIVSEALSKIFTSLYQNIDKNIKSIPNIRSAFTFYNDKTMSTQQTAYKKKIKELDSKLTDIEDKYYKQFAAMEKAMAKLQEQQSQMSGFFGTN